jgi:vacuolar-type H+-ATPase subunit E/Vma4
MNFTDPRFWLDVVLVIVSGMNLIAMWLRKPGSDALAAVKAVDERVKVEHQAMTLKVQALEDHVAHMPTDEELATLRGDVHSIKAQLEGQRDLLKRVEHQTQMIHDHLLNNRNK